MSCFSIEDLVDPLADTDSLEENEENDVGRYKEESKEENKKRKKEKIEEEVAELLEGVDVREAVMQKLGIRRLCCRMHVVSGSASWEEEGSNDGVSCIRSRGVQSIRTISKKPRRYIL